MTRAASYQLPIFRSDRGLDCHIKSPVSQNLKRSRINISSFDFEGVHEVEDVRSLELRLQVKNILSSAIKREGFFGDFLEF